MLSKDTAILVSYLNMKLRDDDMPLELVIETANGNVEEIIKQLENDGYAYNKSVNQIKKQ